MTTGDQFAAAVSLEIYLHVRSIIKVQSSQINYKFYFRLYSNKF